jgi:hypothetical protein
VTASWAVVAGVGIVAMLAPALLAALVASLTLTSGSALTVDARILGVATAIVALVLRVPTLGVVVIAAAVTALARLLGAA